LNFDSNSRSFALFYFSSVSSIVVPLLELKIELNLTTFSLILSLSLIFVMIC